MKVVVKSIVGETEPHDSKKERFSGKFYRNETYVGAPVEWEKDGSKKITFDFGHEEIKDAYVFDLDTNKGRTLIRKLISHLTSFIKDDLTHSDSEPDFNCQPSFGFEIIPISENYLEIEAEVIKLKRSNRENDSSTDRG